MVDACLFEFKLALKLPLQKMYRGSGGSKTTNNQVKCMGLCMNIQKMKQCKTMKESDLKFFIKMLIFLSFIIYTIIHWRD